MCVLNELEGAALCIAGIATPLITPGGRAGAIVVAWREIR
jgi:hypothetical protein